MSKRNENRPGYKKTKVGWIPEDWKACALKQICDVIQDGTHFSPQSKSGPYRYLTSKNILFGRMDITNCGYISKQDHYKIYNSCPVKFGDVLLTKDGANTGNAAINTLDEPFSLLSSVALIRANTNFSLNNYILSTLLSPYGQYRIKDAMAGQAITRITLTIIKKFQIPLPSLIEQKKIAEILSAWDCAIDHIRRLIDAKQRLKKGLMQQLLMGRMRFPEFGKAVQEKGELPGGWREVRLKDVLKQVTRPIEFNDDVSYELISVRRRSGGLFHRDTKSGHEIATKTLFRSRHGDFLISKMQVVHGAMGLVDERFDRMYISGSYISLNSKDINKMDIRYFDYLSRNPYMYHAAYISSYGVHIEKMTFNLKLFLKTKIKIPKSVHEQIKNVKILKAIESEINALSKKEEKLQQQKKGLMQKLLTGEVRVQV